MRIGVVAAFDIEARMLATAADSGLGSQGQVLMASGGVGAARARTAGEQLLNDGATALLSWGVAAALDRELLSGSLLMPRVIIDVDLRRFAVDHDWHDDLREHLAEKFVVHTEPLAESPAVLNTPAQKRALALRSGASAADMESAALAALAYTTNVPFIAIRAISDAAGARVPEWLNGVIDGAGRFSIAKVISQLVLRPADWAAMSRLAFGFRAARATLTGAARPLRTSLVAAP